MSDLVQKLVGALAGLIGCIDHGSENPSEKLDAARAALSEAKAGGWVAVPVEPTPEMKAEGIKVEVYSEASDSIGALTWAEVAAIYRAMLAAAQAKGADPEDLAAAGVMLMGRRADHD